MLIGLAIACFFAETPECHPAALAITIPETAEWLTHPAAPAALAGLVLGFGLGWLARRRRQGSARGDRPATDSGLVELKWRHEQLRLAERLQAEKQDRLEAFAEGWLRSRGDAQSLALPIFVLAERLREAEQRMAKDAARMKAVRERIDAVSDTLGSGREAALAGRGMADHQAGRSEEARKSLRAVSDGVDRLAALAARGDTAVDFAALRRDFTAVKGQIVSLPPTWASSGRETDERLRELLATVNEAAMGPIREFLLIDGSSARSFGEDPALDLPGATREVLSALDRLAGPREGGAVTVPPESATVPAEVDRPAASAASTWEPAPTTPTEGKFEVGTESGLPARAEIPPSVDTADPEPEASFPLPWNLSSEPEPMSLPVVDLPPNPFGQEGRGATEELPRRSIESASPEPAPKSFFETASPAPPTSEAPAPGEGIHAGEAPADAATWGFLSGSAESSPESLAAGSVPPESPEFGSIGAGTWSDLSWAEASGSEPDPSSESALPSETRPEIQLSAKSAAELESWSVEGWSPESGLEPIAPGLAPETAPLQAPETVSEIVPELPAEPLLWSAPSGSQGLEAAAEPETGGRVEAETEADVEAAPEDSESPSTTPEPPGTGVDWPGASPHSIEVVAMENEFGHLAADSLPDWENPPTEIARELEIEAAHSQDPDLPPQILGEGGPLPASESTGFGRIPDEAGPVGVSEEGAEPRTEVLFCANDPELWGTTIDRGPHCRAQAFDRFPGWAHWISIRRIDTGERVFAPIVTANLSQGETPDPYGFNGNNDLFYGARHLGLFSESCPIEVETRFTYGGWGFGHRAREIDAEVEQLQAAGWAGREIPPDTVFEIAIHEELPAQNPADLVLGGI